MKFKITPVDRDAKQSIQNRIDQKTKPLNSLGRLESVALQMALIQQKKSDNLTLNNPYVLVFAADHGIAKHNISIAGSEVTAQMVANFLTGGAAINAFCRANDCAMTVIDSGVKYPLPELVSSEVSFIDASTGKGTEDFSTQPSMTPEQLSHCEEVATRIVQQELPPDCDVIAFGEMGIGNTSSAAAILALTRRVDANEIVGRGTGITDQQYQAKISLVQRGIDRVNHSYLKTLNAEDILREVGGFEIAQICYGMLAAAEAQKVIIVDGFIVTAAAMLAISMEPRIRDYMVFAHCSDERAHIDMLNYLDVEPLLDLGLRLGEGTGAVLALPLLKSAVAFYNDMATFESAGVVV